MVLPARAGPRPDVQRHLLSQRTTGGVVLVEPYLAGTSSRIVGDALAHVPHRLLALGVDRVDLRRYGEPADNARWHGLDPAGLRRSIAGWLESAADLQITLI